MRPPRQRTLRRIDGTVAVLWLLVGVPLAYRYRHVEEVILALLLYTIVVQHWNGWATNRNR